MIIYKAFPAYLHKDVDELVAFFRKNDLSALKTIGEEEISLKGEILVLPQRVYFDEYNAQILNYTKKKMLYCLYLCHHNGYLREYYLRELLKVKEKENFVIPFVGKLFGDYVKELLEVLDSELPMELGNSLKDFFLENPNFRKRIQSRIVSYWDCFYRNTYPDFKKYVGYRLLQKFGFYMK